MPGPAEILKPGRKAVLEPPAHFSPSFGGDLNDTNSRSRLYSAHRDAPDVADVPRMCQMCRDCQMHPDVPGCARMCQVCQGVRARALPTLKHISADNVLFSSGGVRYLSITGT